MISINANVSENIHYKYYLNNKANGMQLVATLGANVKCNLIS